MKGENVKVTCARLRSNVRYNGPLETVLDSFLENYRLWMRDNPQHQYETYNIYPSISIVHREHQRQ